jgi:hypothetical protein
MAVIAAKEDPRHRSNLNVIGPKEYKNKTVSKLDFFECDPAALELYFTRDMSEDQKAKFKLSPRELSQKEYFELVRIIRPDYPLPKNYDQVVKVVSQ